MELINRDYIVGKIIDLYSDGDKVDERDKVINDVIDIINNAPEIDTSDLISKSALKIAISEATYGFTEIPIRVDKVIALIDSFSTMPLKED